MHIPPAAMAGFIKRKMHRDVEPKVGVIISAFTQALRDV